MRGVGEYHVDRASIVYFCMMSQKFVTAALLYLEEISESPVDSTWIKQVVYALNRLRYRTDYFMVTPTRART